MNTKKKQQKISSPDCTHHCTMYFNPNDYKVSDQYNNISSTTNIINNQQFITQTIQDMENFKAKSKSPNITRQLLFIDDPNDDDGANNINIHDKQRVHNANIYNPTNTNINVIVKTRQRPVSAAPTRSKPSTLSNKTKAYYWNHKYEEEQKQQQQMMHDKENTTTNNINIPKLNLSKNKQQKQRRRRPQSAAVTRNIKKHKSKKHLLGPWERSATALQATKARLDYKEKMLVPHDNNNDLSNMVDVYSIPKANKHVSKLSKPRQIRRKFIDEEKMKKLGFKNANVVKRKRPMSAIQRKRMEEKQQRLSEMSQPRFKREKFQAYNGINGNKDLKPSTRAMKIANELIERVGKYDKFMAKYSNNSPSKRKKKTNTNMRPSSAPARRKAKVNEKAQMLKTNKKKQFNLSSSDAAEKHVKRCIKRREQKVKDFYLFIKALSDAKYGLMKMPDPTVTIDTFENLIGEIQILTLEVIASIESWRKQLLEKKTLNRFNVSTKEYIKPPPFMWKLKGDHNFSNSYNNNGKSKMHPDEIVNENGEVNYLLHITSSLDFLSQSNTKHYNKRNLKENDHSTIDFKGIVLSLKPKLALQRNPFLLTTDALWGDRAPFFTAERVILDEERRALNNGNNHRGHFVSFVSSHTHHRPISSNIRRDDERTRGILVYYKI